MIEFISFIGDMVNRLISLMADDILTQYFGVPFLYILIGFFIIWVVTNIFIIRPFVGGSLTDIMSKTSKVPSDTENKE